MLARWASYNKKMLARQIIPLAPGYRRALSSRLGSSSCEFYFVLQFSCIPVCVKRVYCRIERIIYVVRERHDNNLEGKFRSFAHDFD